MVRTMKYSDLVAGVEDIGALDERGNEHRTRNWLLTEQGFAAAEQGYLCANCGEWPLPEAFPKHCPICQFNVRDEQTNLLVREHQGTRDMGPSPAMKALEEEREREAWIPATGVWLPGDPL